MAQDPKRTLYMMRLQKALEKCQAFQKQSVTVYEPEFESWQESALQALQELLPKSGYAKRFEWLHFCAPRARLSSDDWAGDDQEEMEGDLKRAESILQEAAEEATLGLTNSESPVPSARTPTVKVENTIIVSQSLFLDINQAFSALDRLGLAPDDQERAKTALRAVENEMKTGGSLKEIGSWMDILKTVGKGVFEKVALPVLAQYIKQLTGLP